MKPSSSRFFFSFDYYDIGLLSLDAQFDFTPGCIVQAQGRKGQKSLNPKIWDRIRTIQHTTSGSKYKQEVINTNLEIFAIYETPHGAAKQRKSEQCDRLFRRY